MSKFKEFGQIDEKEWPTYFCDLLDGGKRSRLVIDRVCYTQFGTLFYVSANSIHKRFITP